MDWMQSCPLFFLFFFFNLPLLLTIFNSHSLLPPLLFYSFYFLVNEKWIHRNVTNYFGLNSGIA